jgi:hypothetical protein
MTQIEEHDAKNYRSAPPHKALRPFRPANEVGPARLSEIESGESKATVPAFVADFFLEHSSSGESVILATVAVTTDTGVSPPTAAKLRS